VAIVKGLNIISDAAEELLEQLCKKAKDDSVIVWFGAMSYVYTIQKHFKSNGKRIDFVIDNDPLKWGNCLEDDLIIFPVEQIVSMHHERIIFLISDKYKEEIIAQLMNLGCTKEQIIILPEDLLHQRAMDYLTQDMSGFKALSLRELQMILFNALKVFSSFCNDNNLKYFLSGGTLLGAIRHEGFIPWDDDIDVYMPYEDYIELIAKYPKAGRYEMIHWERYPEFLYDFGKFADTDAIYVHKGFPYCWQQNVAICVIPLCGYPENAFDIAIKRSRDKALDEKWFRYYHSKKINDKSVRDIRREITALKNNLSFYSSPNVSTYSLMNKPRWCSPREWFEPISVKFEGESFTAPIGYDKHLKSRYGDYMILPPENERKKYDENCFWKIGKI
jgi:phosphorylcholine metabolism protein LicD